MTAREVMLASLRLLNRRDRRLLTLALVIQMATALLDLAGVAMLGLVGTLAVSNVDGDSTPRLALKALSALGLEGRSSGAQIAILAGSACALLLGKSVLSPMLTARVLRFLARRETLVSSRLARELLSRPLTFLQQRSSYETAVALVSGVSSATLVVLGQFVAAMAEIALLTVLTVALLVVNPPVALGSMAYFIVVSVGLQSILGHRAADAGFRRREADTESSVLVQEAVGTYREITVSDRRSFYVDRFGALRSQASQASARYQLISLLPKYISEGALVLGGFALAGLLFTTQTLVVAAGTFALFLASATRVMPSLLRLQAAGLAIRNAAGFSDPVFRLARELGYSPDIPDESDGAQPDTMRVPGDYPGFVPTIAMRDVHFSYPGAHRAALAGITLSVEAGCSIALVGRSGSGKSTLADVILGILQPDSGEVALGGLPPAVAVRRWPGGIAYVPQDVMLVDGTVRANVALGLPTELVDDAAAWDALRRAHLDGFIRALPDGLDTQVGERGVRLSGGQGQRLGIARALFTSPKLLVLDEATSALDAETEDAITQMLGELAADVTLVVIAHRLSTVRQADVVIYLEDGRAVASGKFDELSERVPALRRQASLMGIEPGTSFHA